MFPFKKPPTRTEAAVNVVSDVFDSLSHHAHDWLEIAHDKLEVLGEHLEHSGEIMSDKIEDAVETSPLDKAKSAASSAAASGVATVASAAEKLGALGAGAATGAALAGKSVADKVGGSLAAVREPATQTVPDVKRARQLVQAEINDMNKKAAKYKRELEKELARDQELFAAEQDRLQREYEQLQAQLETARQQAERERGELSKRQRKADKENDIVRVPIAPTDEVVAIDNDGDGEYEYRDANFDEKPGGGNTWLIVGGVLLASAGAIYYLFSSSDGRRKRAAIQDRVGQVADSVREKATKNSDETGEAGVEEVAEAATEAFDRSNEKIADDETLVAGIDAKLPPTTASTASSKATSETTLPDKAVDKVEEVSDKVADGIAGAGAFLANKLEAAGAGAKSAAHSAAEKLDEAKDKTVAKIEEARKPAPTQAPNAVVVEIITDEPPKGETTEEILAEVEQTVRNIEDSVRDEKK